VTRVRPAVLSILNGMTGTPAYVRNARLDILALNDLCLALYDGVLVRADLPFNLARFVFLDPYAKAFFLDWETIAQDMVGALRTQAGRDPLDRGLSDLIGELTTRSDGFAARWARQDVRLHRTARKRLANRVVGEIELTGDALDLGDHGQPVAGPQRQRPRESHCRAVECRPSSGRAQTGEKPPFPGATARCHQGVGLSCAVCSGSRTEQWKPGKDLLQVDHLTRYELGDGEGDDLGRTVDVGDHAARFRRGEATEIGAQTQLDLVRVDRVDVEVDGHLRGAGVDEPVEQWRAAGP
jgi:hypothetical protein